MQVLSSLWSALPTQLTFICPLTSSFVFDTDSILIHLLKWTVSEHCGQFHIKLCYQASLAIVSKYRNLKMHSQHFFSVKILSSVRKNEVACQPFIHFYPKRCLALSAGPIVIFHFLSTIAKRIEFSSFIFLKNYPDLSADSLFCLHQKLDLPSSPVTTLSFNERSLLSVILFSNFPFN